MINLIKDKRFKNVLSFLISYRFIMQLLITPFLIFLGKSLINHYEVQFMTTEKMIVLLGKPSVWIYLLLGLTIMMFLLMLELSSVIVLSQYDNAKKSLLTFSILVNIQALLISICYNSLVEYIKGILYNCNYKWW